MNLATTDTVKKRYAGRIAQTEFSGPDWRIAYGETLNHARFDLTEGSRSRKVFDDYMADKAAKLQASAKP